MASEENFDIEPIDASLYKGTPKMLTWSFKQWLMTVIEIKNDDMLTIMQVLPLIKKPRSTKTFDVNGAASELLIPPFLPKHQIPKWETVRGYFGSLFERFGHHIKEVGTRNRLIAGIKMFYGIDPFDHASFVSKMRRVVHRHKPFRTTRSKALILLAAGHL
jgi:hypothetical protein